VAAVVRWLSGRSARLVWVAVAVWGVWLRPTLAAQSTTAAIRGVVAGGGNAEGAPVRVVNEATGYTITSSIRNGFFIVRGLEPGGPYTIEVRRIGYALLRRSVISLSLGEQREVPLTFEVTTRLDRVQVTANNDRADVRIAGGAGMSISDSALRRLPTLNEDVYDFLRMVPQVSTRLGIFGAGANFRLNQFTIDGVSDRQLQGNVTTSGANGTQSISLEAIKEYNVLIAPFDARYGDFAGLLMNAVTKSGTNELHGSAYGHMRGARLARPGSFLETSAYDREQYGFTLGGPIVRDRLLFFVASEVQRSVQPARGPYVGQDADAAAPVPVSADSITRFVSLLRDRGIDAGDGGRVLLATPNMNVLARVDIAVPEINSRLVVRDNYSRTQGTSFERSATSKSFPLSSVASATRTIKHTSAVQLFTQLSPSVFNELQAGHTGSPIVGVPYTLSPVIQVSVQNAQLSAGPPGAGMTSEGQSTEVGDHLTLQIRSTHTLGLGAHVEFFRYSLSGYRGRLGQWVFSSLDSLSRGLASSFALAKDFGSSEVPAAGAEPSVYVSDEWRVDERLTVTLGLRADGLRFSRQPAYNPQVDSIFHRRTSDYPVFRPQWSPRFGFTWSPSVESPTTIHGGAGVFAGRPPMGWLLAPMRSTGAGIRMLTCNTGNVPAFRPYPAVQPTTCTNGIGFGSGPVTLVDRHLNMAQSFRTSLAVERRFPWSVTGSVEGLYSRIRSDFVFSNLNLQRSDGLDPHGRVMYGTFDAAGGARPTRIAGNPFAEVTELHNQSGGYSWSATAQLRKPWSDGLETQASYTYSRVRDVQSVVNGSVGTPLDIWASARPLSGGWDDQATAVSAFEIPHRVVLSATYVARWRHRTTDISLYYVGESGAAFTYGDSTATTGKSGDLNADGSAADDPIYVPRNATDPSEIVFAGSDSSSQAAQFERFIRDTPCLRRQRGRILARNSCRAPWVNTSNLSVRQSLPAIGGHAASLQLELFNVLNLFDRSWGLLQIPNAWILQYAGRTQGAVPQPIFRFDANNTSSIRNAESGYQFQVSLRYSF
jgi:hypothetical protein